MSRGAGFWAALRPQLRCSFCRRSADEVARLVAGASGYICEACIMKCVAVLEGHGGIERPEAGR
jgi:ATP-dependent Clp protease ATP-binding subunit ClpX